MSDHHDADEAAGGEERRSSGTDGEERRSSGTDGEERRSSGTDGDPTRHAARAAVYAALAGALGYPDDVAVAELTADETADGLRGAAETLDGLDDEVEGFVDAFAAVDAEGLRRVYDDLFGVPDGDGYPVVPYEAEYTVGDEVSHKQRRVATVSGLLDAFGLDLSDGFDERHDHVALELELMQVLAGRRAVAADADLDDEASTLREAEATLLSQHLRSFVPAFAAEVRAALADRHGGGADDDALGPAATAYRATVDLAEALVETDVEAHPPGLAVPDDEGGEAP
ncbi:TorD/DmsD family molecular chaperone [Haloplanus halophilus]|uniref:TorD/DmsD family molecular chaperone n=1 Tax=Haloplanus halophilus TaxID=2949993 RepID=UPI0020419D51|nr:molecular chaperone TorD family protein [Haloplanus sp. GDY1]